MTTRYIKGCDTKEEITEQLALGHFLSGLAPGLAAQVRRDKPKTATEATHSVVR